MKQTAVEWLFQKLWDEPWDKIDKVFEQAKAMHKEEIENAVKYGCSDWGSTKDAEHYYNETFKSKEK